MPDQTPRVDAIVLAGTHQDRRRLILGLNKAFLPLGNSLCLSFVLEALRGAQRVGRIFVVGPADELRRRLPPDRYGYLPVAETGRMLDNALAAYRHAEAIRPPESPREEAPAYLYITADVPLTVPEAIDDFVDRWHQAERERGEPMGLCPGLADDVALAPFYPQDSRRGIRRPYMELRRQRLRLANIYLARPSIIRNREILQDGFSARKLTQGKSVLRLMASFVRSPGGLRGVGHVAFFQAASVFERWGFPRLAAAAKDRLRLAEVERAASVMLGCPFAAVLTPYGGLSLDLDDESDYAIIRENLEEWRSHQAALLPPFPEEPHSVAPGDRTPPRPRRLGSVSANPDPGDGGS